MNVLINPTLPYLKIKQYFALFTLIKIISKQRIFLIKKIQLKIHIFANSLINTYLLKMYLR